MTKRILTLTLFALALPGITALSQENSTPTQALVAFNSSNPVSPTPKDIALKIDGRSTNLLNLSRVPKVFIECANMRNATDAALVTSPRWQAKAARAIAAGLTAFLARAGA